MVEHSRLKNNVEVIVEQSRWNSEVEQWKKSQGGTVKWNSNGGIVKVKQ